ncbi:MAG: hypothetical protein D6735_04245, partial [Acidobacteria bacterium]
LTDQRILSNVRKIRAIFDPAFEARFPYEQPCRVLIKTIDGKVFHKERDFPKGDPRDKLNTFELKEKFEALADSVLSSEQKEQVFQMVSNLESLNDISKLMSLLRKSQTRHESQVTRCDIKNDYSLHASKAEDGA